MQPKSKKAIHFGSLTGKVAEDGKGSVVLNAVKGSLVSRPSHCPVFDNSQYALPSSFAYCMHSKLDGGKA